MESSVSGGGDEKPKEARIRIPLRETHSSGVELDVQDTANEADGVMDYAVDLRHAA